MVDELEPGAPRGLFRFTGLRIALVLIAIGAWIFAVADWQTLGYDWQVDPETPHPEIALATLDPKFGLGTKSDALVVGEAILWRRPRDGSTLILFDATGAQGEPAVRLCTVEDGGRSFPTVGYAMRGAKGWTWLSDEESRALEVAEKVRQEALRNPSSVGELKAAPAD